MKKVERYKSQDEDTSQTKSLYKYEKSLFPTGKTSF